MTCEGKSGMRVAVVRTLGIACAAVMVCAPPGFAKTPPRLTDKQLAESDIIVVAAWDDNGVTVHSRTEWNDELNGFELKQFGAVTQIRVIRSLRGDLEPGRHRVGVGFQMGFPKKRGAFTFAFDGSDHVECPVGDVTQPCLWFLTPERSWGDNDAPLLPALTSPYCIQPLEAEGRFKALLGHGKPGEDTKKQEKPNE